MSLIAPHGGNLVNRILDPAKAEQAKAQAAKLAAVQLSPREAGDLAAHRVHGRSGFSFRVHEDAPGQRHRLAHSGDPLPHR